MSFPAKSVARRAGRALPGKLPPLENGDHLDQKTFHARYEAMPEDVRAELIGGIVFMSSPLKRRHGRGHTKLTHWLSAYDEATPGTEAFVNATAILSDQNEPQPDGCLLITPSHGGQTRVEDDYFVGPPELAVEVAVSTDAIDLHEKLREYQKSGVKEYLVVALRVPQVLWFASRHGQFQPMPPGSDGIFRSEVFPGLWLDADALLRRDGNRLFEVLRQGLATPEHAAFVARLAQQKRTIAKKKKSRANGKKRSE